MRLEKGPWGLQLFRKDFFKGEKSKIFIFVILFYITFLYTCNFFYFKIVIEKNSLMMDVTKLKV